MPPRPAAIRKSIFHLRRVWVNRIPAPGFNYHHAFAFKTRAADRDASGRSALLATCLEHVPCLNGVWRRPRAPDQRPHT